MSNLKIYTLDSVYYFDISYGFRDILKKKTVSEKSLSVARGRKNILTWVKTRLKYLPYLEIESPLDGTVSVIFPQN